MINNVMEILELEYSDILNILKEEYGKKEYHAEGLMKYLYQKGSFRGLENSERFIQNPKLANSIQQDFPLMLPDLVEEIEQGETRKFSMRLYDGSLIESVLIPMQNHYTLCISSQVGCARGCSFCRTAQMGLKRNLSASEMVAQYFMACFKIKKRPENLVFMGMGEPLDNLDEVLKAVSILSHPYGADIFKKNISLSTCGQVQGINRLAQLIEENPDKQFHLLTLSLSLNAVDDSLRDQLMPVNQIWPLATLKKALMKLPQSVKRDKLYIEYIVIPGVNDRPQDADGLVSFLDGTGGKVNLIPLNAHEKSTFQSAEQKDLDRFREALRSRGITCYCRKKKGEDILASCGQLST